MNAYHIINSIVAIAKAVNEDKDSSPSYRGIALHKAIEEAIDNLTGNGEIDPRYHKELEDRASAAEDHAYQRLQQILQAELAINNYLNGVLNFEKAHNTITRIKSILSQVQ